MVIIDPFGLLPLIATVHQINDHIEAFLVKVGNDTEFVYSSDLPNYPLKNDSEGFHTAACWQFQKML